MMSSCTPAVERGEGGLHLVDSCTFTAGRGGRRLCENGLEDKIRKEKFKARPRKLFPCLLTTCTLVPVVHVMIRIEKTFTF
jgi:hypothetical protein